MMPASPFSCLQTDPESEPEPANPEVDTVARESPRPCETSTAPTTNRIQTPQTQTEKIEEQTARTKKKKKNQAARGRARQARLDKKMEDMYIEEAVQRRMEQLRKEADESIVTSRRVILGPDGQPQMLEKIERGDKTQEEGNKIVVEVRKRVNGGSLCYASKGGSLCYASGGSLGSWQVIF